MIDNKRRIDACLKACEGVSTQNLEDNIPFLELVQRYNAMQRERDALRAKIETAENDAAHQKALADSALRVAKGWERKCGELRAKIEAMEQPEQARLVTPTAYRWRHRGSVMWQYGELTEETVQVAKEHNHEVQSLYALLGAQPAPSAPSEEAAAEMGANGGHVVEAERLAFEAWMRGHCWKLGAKWTGTEYRSDFEKGGMVDTHAMRTRELWAAWRDRAALAAAPEAKP